ncbi:MAG: AI-2E family transporter [Pirellulaceae bacterium]
MPADSNKALNKTPATLSPAGGMLEVTPPVGFDWRVAIVLLTATVMVAIAVVALFWAKFIVIPFVLAAFLTAVLGPVVTFLERRGLGRVPSILGIILFLALLGAAVTSLVSWEFNGFTAELPQFSRNVRTKLRSVRSLSRPKSMTDVGEAWSNVRAAWVEDEVEKGEVETADLAQPAAEAVATDANASQAPLTTAPVDPVDAAPVEPIPVAPEPPPEESSALAVATAIGAAMLETLGQVALALVLTIFMLVDRENLRNRAIWLMGKGQLTAATKAVDEAMSRISRFLQMQAIINATYGIALALGLWLIGVEFALLWGFLAAVLRYIPFLGAWIAAIFPVATSFAQFSEWWPAIVVVSLIVSLELITNNVLEPILYGRSLGVSAVGFIVAVAFWTFLWGGIGLLLAGPLTVCLVVAARHIPRFRYLYVLLSDEQALDPRTLFYQRLIARDEDEAVEIAVEYLESHAPTEFVDEMVIPSLVQARGDRERRLLTTEDEDAMATAIREVMTALKAERGPSDVVASGDSGSQKETLRIAALPAKALSDTLPLELLAEKDWDVRLLPRPTIASDLHEPIAELDPHLLCLCSIHPGGLTQLRYTCKRLRQQFPELKIIVARFGGSDRSETAELEKAGADLVTLSMKDLLAQIAAWRPLLTQPAAAAG